MRAVINQGTDKELSWDLEEYISPELVASIQMAGTEIGIDWEQSPLAELLDLLQDTYTYNQLQEMLYDEEPSVVAMIQSDLDTYHLGEVESREKQEELARLYLPVMIAILNARQCK